MKNNVFYIEKLFIIWRLKSNNKNMVKCEILTYTLKEHITLPAPKNAGFSLYIALECLVW